MDATIAVKTLALSVGGSGPPILFIHGFGSSKFTWRHVCLGVRDVFTYYSIDLPGSGASPAPGHFDYSLDHLSDVVTEFIVRKDLSNLTVVGASLGGGVLLYAMLRHYSVLAPRIKSLCIIAGMSYPQTFPFFVGLLRIPLLGSLLAETIPLTMQVRSVLKYCYFDKSLITDGQIERYERPLKRPEVRKALRQTARRMDLQRLSNYAAKFHSIHIPTLLIWGRQDRVVPLEVGKALARGLPRAELVIIDRCGHLPQEECSSKVVAAIRRFCG